MTKPRFTPAYPAKLRERGVWLIRENRVGLARRQTSYIRS